MSIKYRGPKSLLSNLEPRGINYKFNWRDAPYGGARRKAILEHLEKIKGQDHHFIMINARHCLILKRDPDLRRLLKEGKVKIITIHGGGKARYSALVLNEEVQCE